MSLPATRTLVATQLLLLCLCGPSLGAELFSVTAGAADEGNKITVAVSMEECRTGGGCYVHVSAEDTGTASSTDFENLNHYLVSFDLSNKVQTQIIYIDTNEDTQVERDETFQVRLHPPMVGGSLGTGVATATIRNDDTAELRWIPGSFHAVDEPAGWREYSVELNLSANVDHEVRVDYAATSGSATEGSDFATATGTLTFPGLYLDGGRTVTVRILGDDTVEGEEEFTIELLNVDVGGRTVGVPSNYTYRIRDDDVATLAVESIELAEGDQGTTAFPFFITLDRAVDVPLDLEVTLHQVETDTADVDALSVSRQLLGIAGERHEVVAAVRGDTVVERDERFRLEARLIGLSDYQFTSRTLSAYGTIVNDDTAQLRVEAEKSYDEGDAGTTLFEFEIVLEGDVEPDFSVSYGTQGGNATVGEDYIFNSDSLLFDTPVNGQTRVAQVLVHGDEDPEPDESFHVQLATSNLPGLTLSHDTMVGIILDDDGADPGLVFRDGFETADTDAWTSQAPLP